MGEDTKKSYIPGIIVVTVMIVWFSIAIIKILAPDLEIGDNVRSQQRIIPVNLKIVNIAGENLYLYDRTRDDIVIYDYLGNISYYDFTYSGEIYLIDIDETSSEFTVYFTGMQMFYVVAFSGEIMDVYPEDNGVSFEIPDFTSEYEEYSVSNMVILLNVFNKDEMIFSSITLMPLIIGGGFAFIYAMLFLSKRFKKQGVIIKKI